MDGESGTASADQMWHCSTYGDERTLLMRNNREFPGGGARSNGGRITVSVSILILTVGVIGMVRSPRALANTVSPPAASHQARPSIRAVEEWSTPVASPAGGITVSSPNVAN